MKLNSSEASPQTSLAQRVLDTVCIPCGNGRCDEMESFCNRPEDCPQ
jgi:hypothetical protein